MQTTDPNELDQADDTVELQDQPSAEAFEETNLTVSFAAVGLPHVPDPKS